MESRWREDSPFPRYRSLVVLPLSEPARTKSQFKIRSMGAVPCGQLVDLLQNACWPCLSRWIWVLDYFRIVRKHLLSFCYPSKCLQASMLLPNYWLPFLCQQEVQMKIAIWPLPATNILAFQSYEYQQLIPYDKSKSLPAGRHLRYTLNTPFDSRSLKRVSITTTMGRLSPQSQSLLVSLISSTRGYVYSRSFWSRSDGRSQIVKMLSEPLKKDSSNICCVDIDFIALLENFLQLQDILQAYTALISKVWCPDSFSFYWQLLQSDRLHWCSPPTSTANLVGKAYCEMTVAQFELQEYQSAIPCV